MTLGVITASAGALTMTSTALAKKKEQDEAKAAQLAHLQAEQALQAETASANYAENQQKQAQATANVVMAGKQSQANKNFWYAYALWQQKVAQALARRRAEELARKRAEAEAQSNQPLVMTKTMRNMLLIALSVGLLLLLIKPHQNTKPKDEAYLKPYDGVEQSCGLLYPSDTMDTIRCSVGAALTITTSYLVVENAKFIAENFGTPLCWIFAIGCPWYDLGFESYANSNTLPHAQAFPQIQTQPSTHPLENDDTDVRPTDGVVNPNRPEEPNCPINVLQIFQSPTILANFTPEQISCAFDPNYWLHGDLTGTSDGTKFILKSAQSVVVRYSINNGQGRHFWINGQASPYWVVSGSNMTPSSKIWVAPDGSIFSDNPIYYLPEGNLVQGIMYPPSTSLGGFSSTIMAIIIASAGGL